MLRNSVKRFCVQYGLTGCAIAGSFRASLDQEIMMAKPTLTIDIVSDVVCPWCVIGYRQLEKALEAKKDQVDAKLTWHPFELGPTTPQEGQNMADYVRERYGASPDQSRANRDRITQTGAGLGITFNYSDDSRIYNSFKAHQLLLWAAESDRQTELKLALFQAYFTDQANIADDAVLMDAVETAGLDRDAAAKVLANGRMVDHVRNEEEYWQDQNITGVPAYIINGKYMVPGAQDAETFGRVIDRILEKEAG
jgi:predicted DsbA family dithiol-disulfide isomerase